MGEIITSGDSKVGANLLDSIGCELAFLFNYDSSVDDLKKEAQKLGDLRGRVERSIDAARRYGEGIEPEDEEWLNCVNGIIKEAEEFLRDEDKAEKGCFNGLCPNLKSRYLLSKKAKKMTEEIVKLQGDGRFDRVSHGAFEPRMSILKEIVEELRNPSVSVIGVHGIGGVGKTMLVKEVGRKIKEDKLFDEVVMAVVSQTPNIRRIQEEIAYPLGLRFDDEESERRRGDQLCRRLEEEKSILVILDDIWGRLDLEAVGIPFGDDHKGCKLVVTSRSQDILYNHMDAQKNFLVGVLSEEEAWNLFKKMAGDSVEAPDLKPTAIEVVKECAGLPIAVAAVANALKDKSFPVWEDAFQQLRPLSAPSNINGMNVKKVYSSLMLSYKSLKSEEAKSLFLLCCLFPADSHISIERLFKFGIGLGLFQGINSLEEARNRLHTLVGHLIASCLLLDSHITGSITMHDVAREVGISIAHKDEHMLIVRNVVEFEEWTKDEISRNFLAISLPYSDTYELPKGLECPELQLLLLLSKDCSLKIPNTFFEGMKQLRVLDLTNMCFPLLPSSLYFLTNLQTLCLDHCMLQDIAIIGELKTLESLSFGSADIKELPREIGQLTRLRLLDLRNCFKLEVIPSNVIASLSQLEDLCMENSFVGWGVDGNARLAELKHLSRLITLDIHIPDARILPKDFLFERLTRYRIFIGDVWDWPGHYETSRTLKLKLNSRIQLEFGINMLLRRTEDLHLEELNGIRSVLYDLDEDGFPNLKHLHIQSSSDIEYVISTIEWVPNGTFSNLESLFLHNLINLKEICPGQLPVESFCNLRIVEVKHCDRLKKMFSFSMARSLLQLQEIDISECKIMDAIVAERRVETEDNELMDGIMFPRVRYLTLQRLPELVSFCFNLKTMPSIPFRRQNRLPTDSGSEDIISEAEHDFPIPLFTNKVAFPSLEFLKLSELSKLKQIWHGQPLFKSCNLRHLVVEKCAVLLNVFSSNLLKSLPNLEIITLESCESVEQVFDLEGLNCDEDQAGLLSHLAELNIVELPRLRNLLSPSMAHYLTQLRGMEIINCDMMEEIVEREKGLKEEAIDKIVFPLLNSIILQDLPSLMSFYPGNHTFECPSLKRMTIAGCPELKAFTLQETFGEGNLVIPSASLFNKKVSLPNLEELKLSDLFSMKAIWRGQFHGESFCRLRVLKVIECHEILNVFPISSLQNLQNLEELSVDFCSSLEEIFELRIVEDEVGRAATLPQLRELRLSRLPKLMHLCKMDSLSPVFQNLMTLEVRFCGSLTYLLPSAIAKNLVEIKSISVRDCKMMTEIIAGEKGRAMNEATFSKLNYLKLKNLPNLTSFCIGSDTFSFPSLEKSLVKECPKLKTFSNSVLSTPKPKKVQVQKDKWLQGGTTIQHSFTQKAHMKELEEEVKLIKNLSHPKPSLPPPPLIPKDNVPPIRWRKVELIGRGTFSHVYLGVDLDSGSLLAVKQLLIAANSAAKQIAQDLEEEVKLLKNLSHPNIVRYLGTVREDDTLNILLDYVSGLSISSLLGKFGSFPEALIRTYTKKLLLGLEYLHGNGIMHGEIKGTNIFVDAIGCVKLADFGSFKAIVSGGKFTKAPYWIAPEEVLQTGHSFSADIWSVGCAVIEMATGNPPWFPYEGVTALFKIVTMSHPPIPELLSVEAKDLLLKCLQREPKLRPTASELLQHPFVIGEYEESHPVLHTSVKANYETPWPKHGMDLENFASYHTSKDSINSAS